MRQIIHTFASISDKKSGYYFRQRSLEVNQIVLCISYFIESSRVRVWSCVLKFYGTELKSNLRMTTFQLGFASPIRPMDTSIHNHHNADGVYSLIAKSLSYFQTMDTSIHNHHNADGVYSLIAKSLSYCITDIDLISVENILELIPSNTRKESAGNQFLSHCNWIWSIYGAHWFPP